MQLSQGDIQKYKKLYLETARNYLENMQANISFLLKGEQPLTSVQHIHIDAHSLKIQSQIMGYNNIAKIAEIIEYLFNKDENENAHVAHDVLIKIQSDLTRLHDSLTEIETQGKELDLTDRINELEKAKEISKKYFTC